jgi:hypothetical protein
VFTARYALSPYIKQIRFVFKGLNAFGISESVWSAPVRQVARQTQLAVCSVQHRLVLKITHPWRLPVIPKQLDIAALGNILQSDNKVMLLAIHLAILSCKIERSTSNFCVCKWLKIFRVFMASQGTTVTKNVWMWFCWFYKKLRLFGVLLSFVLLYKHCAASFQERTVEPNTSFFTTSYSLALSR